MKTYKLIKEYPNSPKLGYISNNKDSRYDCSQHPEFWEEVVEKDYEILQMKNSHGNFYSLFRNEELSKHEIENHTIHSIKRLSDGEV
jgi:hypothetical protein